jgi:molecular chaperone DnaK
VFSTADDNQSAVTVRVFQGEREMAADNRLLGEFNLEGIPPAPRGVPQIEVTFDIDANGILNVSAKDRGTGKEQSVRIEQSGGLSETEIERMRRDAQAHADEDRRKRELAEARNKGDSAVYQMEKLLGEHGDKLGEGDRQAVRAAIEKLNERLKTEDTAAINQAIEELQQASHALSQHLYQQAGATAAGASPPPGAERGQEQTEEQEDVVDADFEVKR